MKVLKRVVYFCEVSFVRLLVFGIFVWYGYFLEMIVSEINLDLKVFVDGFVVEMQEFFFCFEDGQIFEVEFGGDVVMVILFKLVLESEFEVVEFVGLWIVLMLEFDVKLMFVCQVVDEMKYFEMICDWFFEFGEIEELLQLGLMCSVFYQYFQMLCMMFECIVVGFFVCEVVVEVRNQQFIDFCRVVGDEEILCFYIEVIQLEEIEYNQFGCKFFECYVVMFGEQSVVVVVMCVLFVIVEEFSMFVEVMIGFLLILVFQ